MSPITWYKAFLIIKGETKFYRLYPSVFEAHSAIRKNLKMRLRTGLITEDTIVTVIVKDASGYFSSCPQIFPGYYDETLTVSEYLGGRR